MMDSVKKLPFNLVEIAQVFNIKQSQQCTHLDEWLSANYTFNEIEQSILKNTFERVAHLWRLFNWYELVVFNAYRKSILPKSPIFIKPKG